MANSLIIDDNLDLIGSLRRFLDGQGLCADYVTNWQEGLDRYRVFQHQLVVADYDLPGSDHGLVLLAQMRKLRPSCRLLLMSGALYDEAAELVLGTGLVDDYLTKTSTMGVRIAEEVRSADERAKSTTDWAVSAQAFIDLSTVDTDAIKRVDDALRIQVEKRRG